MESQTPKPGIYKGVPFAEYLAWDAISNSRISRARQSLLHFREAITAEPSDAMRLGSFVHCGVLEPLAMLERYAVMPDYRLDPRNTTKDGKASKSRSGWVEEQEQLFRDANANKEIVEQVFYDKLRGIAARMSGNERCRQWFAERGEAEVSLVWVDGETGLLCKARVDYLTTTRAVDLKTTKDAQAFANAIADYGYHRQAAHYLNGLEAVCGGEIREFGFVAVESAPPYIVLAAPINEDAVETGRGEVAEALRSIADAIESGEFPPPENPSKWTLPSWYERREVAPVELVINGRTFTE